MRNLKKVLLCFTFLVFTADIAWALNLGQTLSSMGIIASRQREAENEVMRQRLLELQVEQANRMAVIQQIEYQRRIKELDEARQRELQRQQQLNVEALRREQARVAQIQADEQARAAKSQAEHKTLALQKPLNTQLTEISDHLRKSSPRSLNKGVSLIGASAKENKLYLLVKLDTVDLKTDPFKKVYDELINQISGAVVTTCLDQTLEPLTRQGAVVRYSFFDSKQSFIEGVDTDKTDCVELYGSK
jgi:multidrug efflux pump subunit AcrA (membrane-fusion protein)